MTDNPRALLGATLIDGTGSEPLERSAVVVSGDSIAYAGPLASLPHFPGLENMSAEGQFIIPGVIDCHLHLSGILKPDLVGWVLEPDRQQAMLSVKNAEALVAAGVTTVCDISHNGPHLKRLVAAKQLKGPRIIPCGPGLARTGSFNGDSASLPLDLVRQSHPYSRIADGIPELTQEVRRLARDGAECVKVWATGSLGRRRVNDSGQEYGAAELEAVVQEAHRMGLRVQAHCMGLPGAQAALSAGVDLIVHGYCMDEPTLVTMAQSGRTLVATPEEAFSPYDFRSLVVGPELQQYAGDDMAEKKRAMLKQLVNTAQHVGVSVAVGSDSYCEEATPYGEHTLGAVRRLVECGLTEMEALVSGTSAGALALGLAEVTGTIEAGKIADLIVLGGNPVDDIANLTVANIELVLASGSVI